MLELQISISETARERQRECWCKHFSEKMSYS